jgi:hypothetical protein
MKKIVNYSDILKINFLGYNFADWVTMFKKKYKQEDGTYDFMSYLFDQENKAAYYIMRANLGIFANIYLNVRYASMMNDIEVVGGSKEEQTGGNPLGLLLAIIGLYCLFMMSIDSKENFKATQKDVAKFKEDNPNIPISQTNQASIAGFLVANDIVNDQMGLQDIPLQYQNVGFLNEVVLQNRPINNIFDVLSLQHSKDLLHVPGDSTQTSIAKSFGQFATGVSMHIAKNAANHITQMVNKLPNDDKEKLKVEVGNGGVGQMFVDISLKDPNEGENANVGGQKKSRKIKKNKKSRRK